MKLGMLDTGMIVSDLMQVLSELPIEKTVLLATERSRMKAERPAREKGLDGVFYEFEELLSSDIDTVYAALPNHLHASFARQASLCSKHASIAEAAASILQELMCK